jgi:hypothetical protein
MPSAASDNFRLVLNCLELQRHPKNDSIIGVLLVSLQKAKIREGTQIALIV